MKNLMAFIVLLISILTFDTVIALTTTKTGIPLDSEWKKKVYDYAKINVKHSAWGIAHSERNYQLSIILAKKENIQIDKDVLFATTFFHDIGAIDPFRKKEVDHAVRSAEIAEPLLKAYGFPMKKWPIVNEAILDHMYYAKKPKIKEAILFHDADALDFFGLIGIVRLLSLTERDHWAPSLDGVFVTFETFKHDVPNALMTETAKKIANQRLLEMDPFFYLLNKETFNRNAL